MANERIKLALFKSKIPQWRLAEAMGISEFTLSRKLRHDLPEAEQKRLINIIKSMKGEES